MVVVSIHLGGFSLSWFRWTVAPPPSFEAFPSAEWHRSWESSVWDFYSWVMGR